MKRREFITFIGAVLGYVEGKNFVIEFRWAERVDQMPALAAELVRMNVDVIFAIASTQVEPARQATKTIPIVFASHADPIGTGHVASLSRPGGNVTGLSMLLTPIVTKELELLKERRADRDTDSPARGSYAPARIAKGYMHSIEGRLGASAIDHMP